MSGSELSGMLASVELLLKAANSSMEVFPDGGARTTIDSIISLAEALKSKVPTTEELISISLGPAPLAREGGSESPPRISGPRRPEKINLKRDNSRKHNLHDMETGILQAAETALLSRKGDDGPEEESMTSQTDGGTGIVAKLAPVQDTAINKVTMLSDIAKKKASGKDVNRSKISLHSGSEEREGGTAFKSDWSSSGRLLLDERELNLANEAFSAIDVNGDGRLSPEEIFSVLSCLGIRPTVQELYALMREFDDNDDGNLGLPEFIALISTVKKRMHTAGKKNVTESLSNMTELMKTVHQESTEGDYIGNSPYILHPNHPLQGVWDLMISVLLGITMITIPLTLAFEGFSERSLPVNVTIDFIFLLDIVKNFNSGTVNSDDVVILDRKLITRQYITSWFFLDLFSSVPLELFVGGENSSGGTQYTRTTKSMKLLRLLKLAKLFRLLKVNRVFWVLRIVSQVVSDRIGVTLQMKATWNLCRLFMQLLLIAHWVGCLNFMICRLYDFPEESWVSRLNIRDAPNSEQWSWSFYKALSYMIGVGLDTGGVSVNCMDVYYELNEFDDGITMDVRRNSEWCEVENWNILICLYVGAVFCALLISEVSSIIISVNAKGQAVQDLMHKANDYMRAKRLPVGTRDKVRKFLYSEYSTDKILYNEEELLNMLPETLVTDILTFKTREVVEACPLLKEHSKGFQASVSNAIKPHIAFADDPVFEENTSGQSIFFINSGVVQVVKQVDLESANAWGGVSAGERTVCAVLSNGCYFGDVGCFFNIKRTAGVVAITLCNLYSLDQEELFKLLDDFPAEKDYMINIAASRLKRMDDIGEGKMPDMVDGDDGGVLKVVDEEDKKTELLRIGSLLSKYEQVLGQNGSSDTQTPIVIKKRRQQSTESIQSVGFRKRALLEGDGRPGTPQMSALSPQLARSPQRRRPSGTHDFQGAHNAGRAARKLSRQAPPTGGGLRKFSRQVQPTVGNDGEEFQTKRREIEAMARREVRRQSVVLEEPS
jgi:CRP-like cAMP-binding protein